MENEEIASAFLAVGKSLAVEKRYQEALEKYEQGISVYLEIYKMKDNSPDRQKYLFGIIDKNLSIAEDLKKIIKSNQVSGSVDASPRATSSNAPPHVQKSVSATVAAPRAGSVPDHHNYHVATKKSTPTSSSPRANIAANFGFSKARTSPIRSKEKKVETVSSAKSNEYENQIIEEMLDHSPGVHWSDIAGLAFAKQTLLEAVVLPNLRPDLFVGLRSPPRGVLLFGPPGTGKTMLAKAVATESGFSFFSISASSVTSKYLGDGEKLMKALFEVARKKQPAVIFFDEIDALMSTRKEGEHEASRRLKTEFLTQLDGASTSEGDRLLIMGATNIPWEIDEAVLRRLVKRVYVPLPDEEARRSLLIMLLSKQAKTQQKDSNGSSGVGGQSISTPSSNSGNNNNSSSSGGCDNGGGGNSFSNTVFGVFSNSSKSNNPTNTAANLRGCLLENGQQVDHIVRLTAGYSASDLTALIHESAMAPLRSYTPEQLRSIRVEDIRSISAQDVMNSMSVIRPSVSGDTLKSFQKWAEQYAASAVPR